MCDIGDEVECVICEIENLLELCICDCYCKLIGKINSILKCLEDGDYGYCVDIGEEIGLDCLEVCLIVECIIDV